MDTLVIDKNTERESLDSWLIESQLAEIGVPYLPLSWQDEFLMAENLQNYFAEVIAKISHIKREFESLNLEERTKLDSTKLKWIQLSRVYRQLNLAERQQILINLMKDNKYLSENYDY